MIAETLERLRGLAAPRDAWVVTARDLVEPIKDAVPEIPGDHVIGEPVGKNTAPAIALAAWWLRGEGPEAVVLVLPSDHRIEPASRFREDLKAAASAALEHRAIVLIGVPPNRPETGLGYIEVGDLVAPRSQVHAVAAFREKPDRSTAMGYLAEGRYLWNAGMFVFRPDVMLEELRAHAPEIAILLEALPPGSGAGAGQAIEKYYREVPSISIDYAVMERTRNAMVLRARFDWDDVGSWAALAGRNGDASGNWVRGRALLEDSKGVIAVSEGGWVAALGVEDLVIVRTDDVTLVCSKDRAQEVRTLVERLKKEKDAASLL
jgi:mannose-1-phosphate guanylyltransferase